MLKFCIVLLVGLTAFSAVAQEAVFLRALNQTQIRKGPSETFSVMIETIELEEPLLLLGISPGKKWLQVMKKSGVQGWVPKNRVERSHLSADDEEDLLGMVQIKRKITSRWILTAGGSFGSRPLAVGVVAMPFLNLFRNGVFGRKTDQLELGTGFGFHFYSEGTFWEAPLALQWIFRTPFWHSFMIGPRVGFAVVNDPFYNSELAIPFEGGLHARYYFDDTWGIYADALAMARSEIYVMGGLGLTARF